MSKKEYIAQNKEWLIQKVKEENVFHLSKGVYCKVLKDGLGKGESPTINSVITVHYVGKTINGKTFDSSRGGVAPAFRLRDLIPGWIIALQQMRPGDQWEIYVPAKEAYGKYDQPGIPGGSTLIFDIELLSVQ